MQVEVLGFDKFKGTCTSCPDFPLIYSDLLAGIRNHHVDFVIHDGFLFRASKLCILKTSFRDFLVREMHVGGLAGHLSKAGPLLWLQIASIGPLSKEMYIALCVSATPIS